MNPTIYALVELFFRLITLLFLLRFLLQAVSADRHNPIVEAVVKASDPLASPLRKIIPGTGRWDLPSALLAWLSGAIFIYLSTGGSAPIGTSLLFGAIHGAYVLTQFYWWSILIVVVVSFINQGSFHPIVDLLELLLEPIMAPVRRVLPTMGPLDFSPMVALIFLSLLQETLRTLTRSV